MDIYDPKDIRAALAPLGFHFSKAMGQNFLIDSEIPGRIASEVPPGAGVLEIGPGIGALTAQLVKTAGRLAAVELDRRFIPFLPDGVAVIQADVLKTDLQALAAEHRLDTVAANLPYSITSPIIQALMEAPAYKLMLLMVQKEVALRLSAAPGTAAYGAFTVFVRAHCDCGILFDVPPESFMPRPGVMSSVIRLTRRDMPVPINFKLVRAAFAQRRKTLLNALSAGLAMDKELITQKLTAADIDPGVRGETLGMEEFLRLTEKFLL